MSLIPAFEIGLMNAWILMIIILAAGTAPLYLDNEKTEKRCEDEPSGSELSKTTRIVHVITHIVILPVTLIYGIFLPLKLGTLWFYVGLPIYLIGLVMVLMSSISFAVSPLSAPLTKGIYIISRHPMYVGMFIGYVGTGIACASWVFLLCALVWLVSWRFGVVEEERILLENYGDAYKEYTARTPRWIGLPRS